MVMDSMQIADFRITRFQFARDRVIGDSQVHADEVNVAAIELIDGQGNVGLGFVQSLFHPLPSEYELNRVFRAEAWPGLEDQTAGALAHRVTRSRGGNTRRMSVSFEEGLQQAVWDLFAKSTAQPLWALLGGRRRSVRAYASGLDFHLSDAAFQALFAAAAEQGFTAFKIKVGHPDVDRDIHRLNLLKQAVGPVIAQRTDKPPRAPLPLTIMVDANEAWTARQTLRNLELFRRAGHEIFWVEDPVLRSDLDGLRLLRTTAGPTLINSGEYLDVSDKRRLVQANATDMLNVHGHVTDVMRIGWLAADMGVPVTLGNSFLEIGVNMALALPEVEWVEYSYQNFEHLVERPFEIRDGFIWGSEAPGHGLVLSETARRDWRRPQILDRAALGEAPPQCRLSKG
jgi:L-alanine-DL-glutamate epimerase-like enolase superfamily enzyme